MSPRSDVDLDNQHGSPRECATLVSRPYAVALRMLIRRRKNQCELRPSNAIAHSPGYHVCNEALLEDALSKDSNNVAYIKRIGLYRNKAHSILNLSRELEARYDGIVPSSYKDLLSLPGVGRKTANVVRSVAFDIPSFAVDTHVDRVSKRLGLAKPYDTVEKVEEKLKRKIDRDRWNQAHHDFIFFGRYLCTARNPKCSQCPFTKICKKDKLDAYKQKQ